MHYLITGHTGFKGSWLTVMLEAAGHQVSGLALDPEPESLFSRANIHKLLECDFRADIRDDAAVRGALGETSPDVVIHMAAQPLVRESYRDPRWTMETNVMGTFNVLEAVSATENVQALLVVTTDKVYRNEERADGYRESDPLGGHDPYSASKAMADLLAQSWVKSFNGPPTAIARAGNVIGGGDTSQDRLLPDLLRSVASGQVPTLRYPDATRPWQHVLDCLNGYLLLVDRLLESHNEVDSKHEWNFGPSVENVATVRTVAELVLDRFDLSRNLATVSADLHESTLLALNSERARKTLDWDDLLNLEKAIDWTVEWFIRTQSGQDALEITRDQVAAFRELRSLP